MAALGNLDNNLSKDSKLMVYAGLHNSVNQNFAL